MSRHTGPVCRLCRREGTKLFLKGTRCLTDKCAVDKRAYAPGQHGQNAGRGRKVSDHVKQALVVPGSGLVKRQAEREGLDRIFKEAGFDWREPGCSMCLAMNPDKVPAQERCASTSNRNFVGRQGPGARTHLLSPAMAAAAAVTGHLTDVRELMA